MASVQNFWRLGHKYTDHKISTGSYLIGMRRYKSMFGVSPSICFKIWKLLEIPPSIKPIHLLWTLNFLKQYNTEHTSKAIFKINEKTYRKYVWIIVEALAEINVVSKTLILIHRKKI